MTRGASERPVRGCVCVSVCVRELLKTRPCCTQPAIRHAHHSHGSCPSPPAVSGLADELSSLRPVRRPPGTLRRRIRRRRFRLRCRRRLRLRLHDSRRFRRLELWPAHRLGRGRRLSLRLDRLWLNRGMLRGMLELGVTCLRRYAAIPCRQRPVRAGAKPTGADDPLPTAVQGAGRFGRTDTGRTVGERARDRERKGKVFALSQTLWRCCDAAWERESESVGARA